MQIQAYLSGPRTHRFLGALLAAAAGAGVSAAQQDFVVPAGTLVTYDTAAGPLFVSRFVIEPGATFRVTGLRPLRIVAKEEVRIDGRLDASGADAIDVTLQGAAFIPKPGALGGPGGAAGGAGSPLTTGSSPAGENGLANGAGATTRGGRGGTTGHNQSADPTQRRGGGGGGGRLAADALPPGADPLLPANLGLKALPGQNGNPNAKGPLGFNPPAGGPAGAAAFSDGDPTNDFFGVALDPGTGQLILGELSAPIAGSGGGGGGDSIRSATFPQIPWIVANEQCGAGGGGGGGLCWITTRRLAVGPQGQILVDGGDGARGEAFGGISNIGAGSGGGSGGMLMLQATLFDLTQAGPDCFSARGGRGGPGAGNQFGIGIGAGGAGGPGLIQLHSFAPAQFLLPAGLSLEDLSAPNAKQLLPLP